MGFVLPCASEVLHFKPSMITLRSADASDRVNVLFNVV